MESERLGFYEKGTKGGYFGYDWMNVMMLRFKQPMDGWEGYTVIVTDGLDGCWSNLCAGWMAWALGRYQGISLLFVVIYCRETCRWRFV